MKQRVYPGGLLVTRAFGDFQAKRPQQGGIPGVVIADCGSLRHVQLSPPTASSSTAPTAPTAPTTLATPDSNPQSTHPLFLILASDGVWDGIDANGLFPVLVDVLIHGKPVPDTSSTIYRGSKSPASVSPEPR